MPSFNVGDRVRVARGAVGVYIGMTGTVTDDNDFVTSVDVDPDCRKKRPGGSPGPWNFYKNSWTLELEAPPEPEQYEGWFV